MWGKIYRNTYGNRGIGNLGGGNSRYLMVVNWGKIYRNTYGNRGIGNWGRGNYGIWRGEFEGKPIEIPMGIWKSVT